MFKNRLEYRKAHPIHNRKKHLLTNDGKQVFFYYKGTP